MNTRNYLGLSLSILLLGVSSCTPSSSRMGEPRFEAAAINGLHKIQFSGETLSLISKWYTGSADSWKNVAAANPGMDPNRVSIGQEIIIPGSLILTKEPMPKSFVDSYIKLREANIAKKKAIAESAAPAVDAAPVAEASAVAAEAVEAAPATVVEQSPLPETVDNGAPSIRREIPVADVIPTKLDEQKALPTVGEVQDAAIAEKIETTTEPLNAGSDEAAADVAKEAAPANSDIASQLDKIINEEAPAKVAEVAQPVVVSEPAGVGAAAAEVVKSEDKIKEERQKLLEELLAE